MSKTFKRKNKTNREKNQHKRLLENKKARKTKREFKSFKEHIYENNVDYDLGEYE